MKRHEVLIFLTGAVTLSLELLASRIMTPYFGVSLYIWSGILSITLTFLAIGYHYGGRWSRSVSGRSLEFRFLALPVASAASIGISAAAYPVVFRTLSQMDLILGGFLGATLLLAFPLIALSALNPLLIGLQRKDKDVGDAGAGRIFFISTVGSVAGVLLTAFVFIPNISNYRAILALAIALCAAVLIFAATSKALSAAERRRIYAGGLVVASLCGIFLVGKDRYLKFVSEAAPGELAFDVRAEYTSMFGNIKVAEVRRRDGRGSAERYFVQDGLVQNRTRLDNTSVSVYTYVLESLVHAYAPRARDVVVLGLGAAIVPRHLKADGLDVTVVEINPRALEAASRNFGFDPQGIRIHIEDARTFVRNCRNSYDAAVVDLFFGDNVPDYLLTKEFFGDLSRCIRPGGAMAMNAFFDEENEESNRRLLATIATAFPNLFASRIQGGNFFIVGSSGPAPRVVTVKSSDLPDEVAASVKMSVSGSSPVRPDFYRYSAPVSDDHNIFGVLFANANMAQRKFIAGLLPASVLVN